MNGFEDIDAAIFVIIFGDGIEMAGIAELFDEDLADLKEHCYKFESHGCHCFFLLFWTQKIVELWNQMIVYNSCDFVVDNFD